MGRIYCKSSLKTGENVQFRSPGKIHDVEGGGGGTLHLKIH
jgi:hypothetical protein